MKTKKKEASRNKRGYYSIEGVDHVSVTTFLKVIEKPFLMRWYASMEKKGLLKLIKIAKKKGWSSKDLLDKIKEQAVAEVTVAERYTLKRSKAGNTIHKAIQVYLSTGKKTKLSGKTEARAFKLFLHWWKKREYKAIKVEQVVSDKKKKVAGTMDVYLERVKDKKRGIGDWKTGKSIYMEQHLQNEVYRYLARKEFPSSFGIIVHIPQDGGKVTVHEVNGKKYPLKTAWLALDLWRAIYE
jgi:hypothetical protein